MSVSLFFNHSSPLFSFLFFFDLEMKTFVFTILISLCFFLFVEGSQFHLKVDFNRIGLVNISAKIGVTVAPNALLMGSINGTSVVNVPTSITQELWKNLKALDVGVIRYSPLSAFPRYATFSTDYEGEVQMEFFDAALSTFYANKPPKAFFELNLATLPAHFFHPNHVDVPDDPNLPVWGYAMGFPVESDLLNKGSIVEYFDNVITLLKNGMITLNGQNYTINDGNEIKYDRWEVLKQDEHGFTTVDYSAIFKGVYDSLNSKYPDPATHPSLAALGGATCGRIPTILSAIHDHGAKTDTVSLHHRCIPSSRTNADSYEDLFDDMERFSRRTSVRVTNYISNFVQNTKDKVKIEISNAAIYLPGDRDPLKSQDTGEDIPSTFWVAAASGFASLFTQLGTNENITNINMGLYSAYPAIPGWNITESFLPTLSLTNWKNGKPNMKYRLVQLLSKYFYPGLNVVPFKIDYQPTTGQNRRQVKGNDYPQPLCLTSDARNGFEQIIIKCDPSSVDPINITSITFGVMESDICGSITYSDNCSFSLSPSLFNSCAEAGSCQIDPLDYINISTCPERRVSFTVVASCTVSNVPLTYTPTPSLDEKLDVLVAYVPASGSEKESAHILVVNKRSASVSLNLEFSGIKYNKAEIIKLDSSYDPESGDPKANTLNSLDDVVFAGFSTSVILLHTV